MQLREAWSRFRPVPGRPLRSDLPPGRETPAWSDAAIDSLRQYTRAFSLLASHDQALLPLAQAVTTLPPLAEALREVERVARYVDGKVENASPTPAVLQDLRAEARGAHELAARALTSGGSTIAEQLDDVWFVARLLAHVPNRTLQRIARFAELPGEVRPWWSASGGRRLSRLDLQVDPRTLAALSPETPRARELREYALTAYTTSRAPEPPEPRLRVRVVAEGRPSGRIVGGGHGARWSLPLRSGTHGWTVDLDAAQVPAPGEPGLYLEFDPPAHVSAVFLEGPGGRPLPDPGRLESFAVKWMKGAARADLRVAKDSVEVAIVVPKEDRVVWDGLLPPDEVALAFPTQGADPLPVTARWGFAGWRRFSGTTIVGPYGEDPRGLASLEDGRAIVAFSELVLIVDPATGRTESLPYPEGRGQVPDGSFSAVSLDPYRLIVCGEDTESGRWAAVLDLDTSSWGSSPPGLVGPVAPRPEGGYAWMDGKTLRRRARDGSDDPPVALDRGGDLLGVDPVGRPVIRHGSGAVRLSPVNGAILSRVEGRPLALESTGSILLFDGTDSRHPELTREVRLRRALPDGSELGPFPMAMKTFPSPAPPLLVATVPDGRLLVLSPSGPSGVSQEATPETAETAVVELWEPVWAGEISYP